jgi:hypothetical protein
MMLQSVLLMTQQMIWFGSKCNIELAGQNTVKQRTLNL